MLAIVLAACGDQHCPHFDPEASVVHLDRETGGLLLEKPIAWGVTPDFAMAGDLLLGTHREGTFALDGAGREVWSFGEDYGRVSDAALTGAGWLVVQRQSGVAGPSYLTALDATTGEERWRTDINPAWGGRLAPVGDTIAVWGSAGVTALAAATGEVRWKDHEIRGDRMAPAPEFGLFFLLEDRSLRAVIADRGSIRWEAAPPGNRIFVGTPAVGDDAVYAAERAGGDRRVLVAYDRAGTVRWRIDTVPGEDPHPLAAGDVVLLQQGTDLVVLGARSGDRLASLPATRLADTSPLIWEGHALMVTEGWGRGAGPSLIALDMRGGSVAWRQELPAGSATIQSFGETVVVASFGSSYRGPGAVSMLRTRDGSIAWQTATTHPARFASSSGDRIVVATSDDPLPCE